MYKHSNEYYRNRFFKKDSACVIRFLYYFTGAIKLYKDGDCLSVLFRWYHPLSWLMFIAFVLMAGIEESYKEMFTISDYWKSRKIEWFSVWDK